MEHLCTVALALSLFSGTAAVARSNFRDRTGMPGAIISSGVWLMGTKVAIQTFDCSHMLCGRVTWLKTPLDPKGFMKRDKLNPNPALRERQVCGPTSIWNARRIDPRHWKDGWFYNPDDGATYRVTTELESDDVMMTRVYKGLPVLVKQKR